MQKSFYFFAFFFADKLDARWRAWLYKFQDGSRKMLI